MGIEEEVKELEKRIVIEPLTINEIDKKEEETTVVENSLVETKDKEAADDTGSSKRPTSQREILKKFAMVRKAQKTLRIKEIDDLVEDDDVFANTKKRKNTKPGIFYPENNFRQRWELFIALLLLYTCCVTPYVLAFNFS